MGWPPTRAMIIAGSNKRAGPCSAPNGAWRPAGRGDSGASNHAGAKAPVDGYDAENTRGVIGTGLLVDGY
jgi:hypothetical protein